MENAFNPKNATASRVLTATMLLCVMLFAMVYRSPLFSVPLERDEGEYAYIAWRMGHGELPYRDWFDQKPPGVFWVYRAALALPMDPVRAIHLAGAVFCGLAAVAIFVAARAMACGAMGGLAGALIFIVMASDPSIQGASSNTEVFMLFPLIAAHTVFLSSLYKGRRDSLSALMVGLLCGVASIFKQVVVFDLAFFIVAYPLAGQAGRLRDFAWMALRVCAGFALPWMITSAYFAAQGGFGDFLDAVLLHNLRYVSTVPMAERWGYLSSALSQILSTQGIVWLGAMIGAMFILTKRAGRGRAVYLLGWLGAGAVGASASGYFFGHYFQPILAPVALMFALGLEDLPGRFQLKSALGQIVTIIILLAQPLSGYLPFVFKHSPREASALIYPKNLFADMPAISRHIAGLTGPDDTVFVFGSEAELYFYSGRKSASRYIFLFPLYGDYPSALKRQRDVMQEIGRNRPRVIAHIPNSLLFGPGHEQYLKDSLMAYIEDGYQIDSLIVVDDKSNASVWPAGNAPGPELKALGWIAVRRQP